MRERWIWLLDDTGLWHEVSAATVARCPGWRFRGFSCSRDLFYGIEEVADDEAAQPRVLLMDFFLRGERGDRITQDLRRLRLPTPLCIVAHSTTSAGNAAILQAGADCQVTKTCANDGLNHELLRWLEGFPR
jgi:DNA-binding NarL/FixJ family response regulator